MGDAARRIRIANPDIFIKRVKTAIKNSFSYDNRKQLHFVDVCVF
jgi:hypothetical protein